MNILILVLKYLPTIISLAEEIFADKPKSGEDKKRLVMDTTQAVIGAVKDVSTGGQKETWDRISDPVSSMVDNMATIMFPKKNSATD